MEVPVYETGLTFEKVWAALKETGQLMKEQAKEADQRLQETDRRLQETERLMKEQAKEADRRLQETERLMKEQTKETNEQIGKLGKKFGSMVEHMMVPNLMVKFNKLGYTFEKYYIDSRISSDKKQIYAEIDLTLENGDCVMIVEVKADPNTNDVKDHVKRMENVKAYAGLHNDQRKFYGALAGALFNKNVRDYAHKQGFYIIEQSGDTVNITPPPGEPKSW
jgi:hypothetical protein